MLNKFKNAKKLSVFLVIIVVITSLIIIFVPKFNKNNDINVLLNKLYEEDYKECDLRFFYLTEKKDFNCSNNKDCLKEFLQLIMTKKPETNNTKIQFSKDFELLIVFTFVHKNDDKTNIMLHFFNNNQFNLTTDNSDFDNFEIDYNLLYKIDNDTLEYFIKKYNMT